MEQDKKNLVCVGVYTTPHVERLGLRVHWNPSSTEFSTWIGNYDVGRYVYV